MNLYATNSDDASVHLYEVTWVTVCTCMPVTVTSPVCTCTRSPEWQCAPVRYWQWWGQCAPLYEVTWVAVRICMPLTVMRPVCTCTRSPEWECVPVCQWEWWGQCAPVRGHLSDSVYLYATNSDEASVHLYKVTWVTVYLYASESDEASVHLYKVTWVTVCTCMLLTVTRPVCTCTRSHEWQCVPVCY